MRPHPASHPIATCSKPLAANASAAPMDVIKMKSTLGALGHYEAPKWGVSQFPDVALFDAIKAFQKSQGLKADGAIKPDGETEAALSQAMNPRRAKTALQTTAQALQSLGRGSDELLAHITKEEAVLLHNATDGASINPQTGLLEFWYDYEADAAGVGTAADNRGQDSYGADRDNDGWGNSISDAKSNPTDDGGGLVGGNGDDDLGAKTPNSLTETAKTKDKAKAQRDRARRSNAQAVTKGSLLDTETKEDEVSPSRSLYDSIVDGIKSGLYGLMSDDEEEKKNSPYVGGLRG